MIIGSRHWSDDFLDWLVDQVMLQDNEGALATLSDEVLWVLLFKNVSNRKYKYYVYGIC